MLHHMTPDEYQRLHATAQRVAVQLRRKALREVPDAAARWLVRAAPSALRAAVHATLRRVPRGTRLHASSHSPSRS